MQAGGCDASSTSCSWSLAARQGQNNTRHAVAASKEVGIHPASFNLCGVATTLHPYSLSHTQEHSPVGDADVGAFVFNDLAQANEATSSSITSTQQLGESSWLVARGVAG